MRKNLFRFLLTTLFFSGAAIYADVPALNDLLDETPKEQRLIQRYVQEASQEISKQEEPKENLFDRLKEEGRENRFGGKELTIQPPQNELVDFFIKYYTTVGRSYLTRSLKQMEIYYPLVEKTVNELGLPKELAVLGIIESGYTPEALSHKGALGIWQLMPLTAKIYGLKINGLVDERMDVEKSTRAALLYLKSLAETFNGNWDLVIASYNGGGGYISSQIRNQKESDFWKLCKISGFKSETLEFVPRFYAVLQILRDPEKYDLDIPDLAKPLAFESINVAKTMTLSDVSGLTGIPDYLLEELNPHYKKMVTVPGTSLFIPRNMGQLVADRMERYRGNSGFSIASDSGDEIKKDFVKPESVKTKAVSSEIRFVSHRVKVKETLFSIAKRYDTSVNLILKYNRIRKNRISTGMSLRIPVTRSKALIASASSVSKKIVKADKKPAKSLVYRVKKGDTLFQIADKYQVKVTEIRKWNRMGDETVIIPGQKIRIYRTSAPTAISYRVRKGDTLYSLSKRFNTSIQTILSYNDLKSEKNLAVGKVILIPDQEG